VGSTVTDPLVGRLVDGRYQVLSRIARGGMATVYLALDRRLDREVALKVMHPHLAEGASGADFVARFRREARTAARLTHPGLVSVFDQGVDGETSYLTMEYVEGTTLRRRLGEQGALSVGEALHVAESVLDALTAAHRAGLVHRDIKPENVLIDTEGRVKLGDFGLARAVTEVTATTSGTVLGTVAYLAPELVGRGVTDARTDVYACGILLFEMLTGRQPFTGETPIQVAYQHVHTDVPPPSSLVGWLPSEVDELVGALTARDPADRPLDAGAALTLLRRTRAALDDETLARRADVAPTITLPAATQEPSDEPADAGDDDEPDGDPDDRDHRPTTAEPLRGSTVALPIGLGLSSAAAPRPPRRRRRWPLVTAIVVVLLAALAGGGYWWYTNVGPGAYTTVPPITNLSEQEAKAALAEHDLLAVPTLDWSDTVPKGTVFQADPPPGSPILKGAAVTYTVSKGVDLVTIPDGIVGVLQDKAAEALALADLTVDYGDPVYDDTAPKGQVMSATIAGGTDDGHSADAGMQVKRHTTVRLVLAQGPYPVTLISVVGATVDDATAQLAADHLTLTVTGEEFDDTIDAGRIVSQVPDARTELHHGDSVQVVVSKGPELVEVPKVVGLQFKDAEAQLVALGLVVDREDIAGGFFGTVRYQSVKAGDMVKKGTLVTLTVV
jgi:serine/threonine-protein kinase